MKIRFPFFPLAATLVLIGGALAPGADAAPPRPQGPCDIFGAAGNPCVAAHSTTRALYAAYSGPLYQVRRESDGRLADIGIVRPSDSPVPDAGGYADAATQDRFCLNTLCVISLIYDQSPKGNHLYQAPPGPQFPGPAKGAFDTQPIADMAPITISGHKAYGVFMMPGMGMRNNNAKDLAINDEAEGIYYVVDGKHYDSGCCFDYGNASTNGRAVGTGTMETTYFGTSTVWGSGNGSGPWIMTDLEAGLFSGYNARQNTGDPTMDSARFVTAVMDGGGGNRWDIRGGDAQKGGLTTYYSGVRPGSRTNNAYFPMHKQGAILLGTGGDNGNGSSGTFYEGVMTSGYPAEATTDTVQANIVAAKYDVQSISLSRVTTFTPRSTQELNATFTNTSGSPATGVKLSVSVPTGWTVQLSGKSATFAGPVAPGDSVSAVFRLTSPTATSGGFLTARSDWTNTASRKTRSGTITARIRNAPAIKINEVRFSTSTNQTDEFIELYNASAGAVDLSNWTLINTQSQFAPLKLATIPAGTTLASGAFYLLGAAASGLAAPAPAGSATIAVRSTIGFEAGHKINIDNETRTVGAVGTAATVTTVFIPVSTGPWLTIPAGSTNLPVANAVGFEIGQKMGIDVGGKYELATVTAVGKAATQTVLAAGANAGTTNIKVAADANILAGDTLTIGTATRKELAKVKTVGTAGASGTGVELAAGLQFDHATGIDVSDPGSGISFSPATRFPHTSGDAVQALGSGITLDAPLAAAHANGAPVVDLLVTSAGYQGSPAPTQWFGGTFSPRGGSIALMDPAGTVVVDAVVYGTQQSNSSANGTITSPELATLEGEQGQGGCMVVLPVPGLGAGISRGRFPDGADADDLCHDFRVQPYATLSAAAASGGSNLKVSSITGFAAGQTITIGSVNAETAVIATVGTAGGTTIGTAVEAGATLLPVAGTAGFTVGQTVTVDSDAKSETAVVAAVAGGRGGARITLAAPLRNAHSQGAQVSGSGITLKGGLTTAHSAGTSVAAGTPTPGAANKY